jgi:nucleotide-binding universal stress UspA family protein
MKILLPVDGTALSVHEVRFALRLVEEGLRAEFVLANVQEPATFFEVVTAKEPELIERAAQEAGEDMLDQPAQLLRNANMAFETAVLSGDPAQAMLDLIGTHEIEMVVMGTRALGWIREAIEGSTSRRLLQYSPVPVLLVKPPVEPEEP